MRKDRYAGNNIPFVEAAHVGGKQKPTAIVLRSSFTTSDDGAALGVATHWHYAGSKMDSCHYVVDDAKTFRCVPDKIRAYPMSTGIYNRAVSINVCYEPPDWPSPQVLDRTAVLAARLCKLHKIKPRILSQDQELAWVIHKWRSRGGIILKTVGEFPIADFFELFQDELQTI